MIRVSTAAAVVGVAGIAAYVSYWHAYEVVRAHGESGVTARLEPATIDGVGPMLTAEAGTPAGRSARCSAPQPHRASCRSCWTRRAVTSGTSSC